MTGYLVLTKGEASLARSGWFAITRAGKERRMSVLLSPMRGRQGRKVAYQLVLLPRRLLSGPWRSGQAASTESISASPIRHETHPARTEAVPIPLTVGLAASLLIDILDAIASVPTAQANKKRHEGGIERYREEMCWWVGRGVEPATSSRNRADWEERDDKTGRRKARRSEPITSYAITDYPSITDPSMWSVRYSSCGFLPHDSDC